MIEKQFVYIIYDPQESAGVKVLTQLLSRNGFEFWQGAITSEDTKKWQNQISVALAIITPEFWQTKQTIQELDLIENQKVPLIPLLWSGDYSSLGRLVHVQSLDLRDRTVLMNEARLNEFVVKLKQYVKKSERLNPNFEPEQEPSEFNSPQPPASRAPEPPPPARAPLPEMVDEKSPGAAAPVIDQLRREEAAENVQFTAFRPQNPTVETWHTLLIYTHLLSAVSQIIQDAAAFKERLGGNPERSSSKTSVNLPRGTKLRVVPTCDGVTFNPASHEFTWLEDWHRVDFRFKPEQRLDDTEDLIVITFYADLLPISTLKLAVHFGEPTPTQDIPKVAYTLPKTQKQTATMYRQDQIFISYSHADTAVALRFRDTCKALGFDVLIDRDKLRSGEVWNDALKRMIEQADIFQLFWSERAAHSKYVEQEWHYARDLQKHQQKPGDFIRPVHWEAPQPIPPPPAELQDLHFAYMPLTGSGLGRLLFNLRVFISKLLSR